MVLLSLIIVIMWHMFVLPADRSLQAASCILQPRSMHFLHVEITSFFFSTLTFDRTAMYLEELIVFNLSSLFPTLIILTKASSSQIVATLPSLHPAYIVIAQPVTCESQTNAFLHYCSFETFG